MALRRSPKLGPARIAPLVGLPTSTGYRVLCRHRLHRLAVLDRPTGEVIRRYERARPGELVHVDVKKLGRLRDGGGHRLYGRDSAQHRTRDRHRTRRGPIGYDYVHAAVDDHSHLAYAEVLPDEQAGTCAGFLRRAGAFFAAHQIAVQRVLTDNAMAYRHSRQVQAAVAELGAVGRFTRPYRPQPTARWSGSTAPCWPSGPMSVPMPPTPNAPVPWTAGCTCTTITGLPPRSAAIHLSAASTTLLTPTPRRGGGGRRGGR